MCVLWSLQKGVSRLVILASVPIKRGSIAGESERSGEAILRSRRVSLGLARHTCVGVTCCSQPYEEEHNVEAQSP
jgi:hypothetical protein